jgi:hypothetical protein
MVPWAGRAAVLWLALWSAGAPAELSSEDYGAGTLTRSDAELAQLRAEIEAARQREVELAMAQARAQAAEQGRLQAAVAAARARLPPGMVLAETHCGTCHAADVLAAVRHTRLGWHLTVLRMRHLNGAEIPAGDLGTIAEYLAQTQGASLAQALLEYGLAVAGVLATWASVRYGLHRRGHARRRGSTGD